MIVLQIVLALILVPIAQGPLAIWQSWGGPNIIIVVTWLIVWLSDREHGLYWAVIAGLLLDLLGFTVFGLWTATLVGLVLLIDYLKMRFFEASSVIQAVFVLMLALVVQEVIFYLASLQINSYYALISIASSAILGAILYYLLAVRMRLFLRWAGRWLA
ncbi:MAG TPA: hypothetical protein VMQ44_00875 [Candidatus Saccharimonadales bacterium]|nr:hypothetical protein [Candidatus Saccharimonadales bacterium]